MALGVICLTSERSQVRHLPPPQTAADQRFAILGAAVRARLAVDPEVRIDQVCDIPTADHARIKA